MESLNLLLANQTFPIWTAFLLGMIMSVTPCIMATNITLIGFMGKDEQSRMQIFWNGVAYIIGKMSIYTFLAMGIIFALKKGISMIHIQFIQQYGLIVLAPILILIGFFILFGNKLNIKDFGFNGSGEKLKSKGSLGAFLLGILFSLAFCPTCGLVYFGMLIPLSVATSEGYILPFIFSIGTAIPVIIVAWLIAFSMSKINNFYKNMLKIEKWLKFIFGILFIIMGIYYGLEFFEIL